MVDTNFTQAILKREHPLVMPIGVYAGLEMIGATVSQSVSDAQVQAEAVLAMHDRFQTEMLLTAMDLSAEAEAFGGAIRLSENEIPTVVGRLVRNAEEAAALPEPTPGALRTAVHLGAAEQLAATKKGIVMGGCIGPFSLAGRLFGVSEALEATVLDADLITLLLKKVTRFLTDYARAFRDAGAAGVIMAEPAAGLLSPRGIAQFSAPYVQQIAEAVQEADFTVVYHNCGARNVHLPSIFTSGAGVYHFGAQVDLAAALEEVDSSTILAGNVDPASIFYGGTQDDVRRKTKEMVRLASQHRNFIISSGCDLPPGVPVENMEAFFTTVRGDSSK